MATKIKTPFTVGDQAATQLESRDVADRIRANFPGNASLFKLVKKSTRNSDGTVSQGSGLIEKKVSDNIRAEAYYYDPQAISKTVVSASSLVITFADVTDVNIRSVWYNPSRDCFGIVVSVSTPTATFETIGDTTFTADTNEELLNCGYIYEQGSKDPVYVQTTDDIIYNLHGIVRFPVKITGTKEASKHVAGGDFFKRMKMYNATTAFRLIDNSWLFGKRPSSGNSTTISTLSVDISSTEGLWGFAQGSHDFGNSMTLSKIQNQLIADGLDPSVGYDKPLLWYMGTKSGGRIFEMFQDSNQLSTEKNELDAYGFKTTKIKTMGPDLHIVTHDGFNYGANRNRSLLFTPDTLQYKYMPGRDLFPNNGIQENSEDAIFDEIFGEICYIPLCGGFNITKVTNMWSIL
jgi:hypothetical protein